VEFVGEFDIIRGNQIFKQKDFPKTSMNQISPYLKLIRFDKPIGAWLLFLPCLFGMVLNSKNQNIDFIYLSILFFIGSFLMRSAGCVVNDILDHNFDKNVERTKNRPIASGKISIFKAIIFLAILLLFSFLILLQFNLPTIILGFISLIFVAIYPLMKRFTFYPQIFLGLTFNLGILFASTAILGAINFSSLVLYFANVVWTIIYDTIYGYQDLEDDLKIGVKSTAIKFGNSPQKILFLLAAGYFLLLVVAGLMANLKFSYFPLILLASAHLSCQIKTCNFADGQSCLKKFKSNFWVGIILLIAIIFG
jgi:4-hydroxybenzoate polyprenyltransferase